MQRWFSAASAASTNAAHRTCTLTSLLLSHRWGSSFHRSNEPNDKNHSRSQPAFLSAPHPHSTSPYTTRPTQRQSRYHNNNNNNNNSNNSSGDTHDDHGGSNSGFAQRPRHNGRSGGDGGFGKKREGGRDGHAGRGPMKDRVPPVPTDLVDPRRRLAVLVDGSNPNLIPDGCTSLDQLHRSSALFATVLPAVLQVGVPVLLRVFAHQLPSAWEPLIAGHLQTSATSSSSPRGTGQESEDDVLTGSKRDGHHEQNEYTAQQDDVSMSASTLSSSSMTGQGGPLSLIPLPRPASSGSATPSAAVAQPRIQMEYFRVERFIPIAMQIEADARHLYELRALNKVEGVCYVCHEVDRPMYVSLMQEQRTGSAALARLLQSGNSNNSSSNSSSYGSSGQSAEVAAFFNQYVFDELGMADESVIDGRSKDGS